MPKIDFLFIIKELKTKGEINMAKKKNKSKKVELSLVFRVLAFVLGVAALCFAFLASVKFTGKIVGTETTLTGFEIMFGKENLTGFSILTVLAFVLPLAGGVLALLKSKLLNIISLVCFVAGAVMLFIVPSFVVLVEGSLFVAYNAGLTIGTILSAIVSILGALVVAYVTFASK